MEKPITYSKHENFNFKEAKTVAMYYANCKEVPTMTRLGFILECDRKQVARFLKVAIIFKLISKEEAEKIIFIKSKAYSKYLGSKIKEIQIYEECIELSDERTSLIKKMEKMLLMFASQDQQKIKEKYLPRIIEIEKYAFK